ncbi:MAG: N-acetyl sugar amidotransferase [Ferruginibacter sp.]
MVLTTDDKNYRQCAVTVMDNIADPDFSVDEKGVSNYCYEYKKIEAEEIPAKEQREAMLERLVAQIKEEGKGNKYDCITGVSGGVDSSYLILLAKKWGLRTLIVHFDNGWNTEIAVNNIHNIIEKTGFDLHTIVVNWEEFRDLQLAYIKSGVVDLEVPTDHAIYATWYKLSKKYNIKTILSGNNVVTEAIMPKSWIFRKTDSTNLINIQKKFGTIPFKTYPYLNVKQQTYQDFVRRIKTVKPLNLVDYNKKEAKEIISREFGWQDYGGKHYESVYTKFFQAYILPHKFGIDKRKPHLSNLILSGQITREDALNELAEPLYTDAALKRDIEFVSKKFGISTAVFESYMNLPRVEHAYYGTQKFITEQYPFLKLLKPLKFIIKK